MGYFQAVIDRDIADLRAAARFARASVRRVVRTDMGASASRALGDLSPGCEIFCATKGQFDLIDAVGALIAQTGSADLDIAVWNVYDAPVRRLAQWQAEGRIGAVRFLIDRSVASRIENAAINLTKSFPFSAIRCTSIHAKFATVSNERWSLAVRTSMNMNQNRRFEIIEVSDDPGLCAYLRGIVDELFEIVPVGFGLTTNTSGLTKMFDEFRRSDIQAPEETIESLLADLD